MFIGVVWLSLRAYMLTQDSRVSNVSHSVLRNAFYPNVKDGLIRYYNGDTFVSLDVKSNAIKPLTTVRGFTDVTRVDWVDNGVVFSVSTAPEWHPVSKQYTANSERYDGDDIPNSYQDDQELVNYHWYLSFTDSSVKLLSVGVDNALLFATPTQDGGLLYRDYPYYALLNHDGSVTKNIASIPDENNERRVITASKDSYVYAHENGSKVSISKYDFASKKDTVLVDSLYASSNRSLYDQVGMINNTVYYLEPTGKGSVSSIHRLDLNSKKSTKIIGSFQGVFRQQQNVLTATHIGNDYTKLYILNDLPRSKTIDNSHIQPSVILPVFGDIYFATINGYVVKVAGSTPERKDIALEKKVTSNDFSLTRNIESVNDNSYTVTFVDGVLSERMQQVYAAVEAAGYNPYEFSFNANPGPLVRY